MRFAIYTRTRTDSDMGSLSHQRRTLQQWVHEHRDELVAEFSDCGVGGLCAPGLQRALRDGQAGRFDVLLVTHPDRLGKRIDAFRDAIEALSATGITVLSLASPWPLTSRSEMLMLRMAAALAEAERDEVARHHRERTRAVMSRRRASGR
jgi:DNA invertase Pin-like site-specific DNA recombinase